MFPSRFCPKLSPTALNGFMEGGFITRREESAVDGVEAVNEEEKLSWDCNEGAIQL